MKREEYILMIQFGRSMTNTYKIIWSDEALSNLKNIIEYLESRWTKREITKFAKLLEKQINRIKNNPFLFLKSETVEDYRKSVLSKQTTLYYTINGSEIRIISLFDNRQNPTSISK